MLKGPNVDSNLEQPMHTTKRTHLLSLKAEKHLTRQRLSFWCKGEGRKEEGRGKEIVYSAPAMKANLTKDIVKYLSTIYHSFSVG